MDPHLYSLVKDGLINLFGSRLYFGSKVLTSNCYTLGNINLIFFSFDCGTNTERLLFAFFVPVDVEIKLDEERFVLPATHVDEVYKRYIVEQISAFSGVICKSES